jgi:hypothetical protein
MNKFLLIFVSLDILKTIMINEWQDILGRSLLFAYIIKAER